MASAGALEELVVLEDGPASSLLDTLSTRASGEPVVWDDGFVDMMIPEVEYSSLVNDVCQNPWDGEV